MNFQRKCVPYDFEEYYGRPNLSHMIFSLSVAVSSFKVVVASIISLTNLSELTIDQSIMTEKAPNHDKVSKKGRKGDAASKNSSRRIWSEARKEIIPLSVGAVALVASSSVNQGVYLTFYKCTSYRLSIYDDFSRNESIGERSR